MFNQREGLLITYSARAHSPLQWKEPVSGPAKDPVGWQTPLTAAPAYFPHPATVLKEQTLQSAPVIEPTFT